MQKDDLLEKLQVCFNFNSEIKRLRFLVEKLENRTDELPEYMMTQIKTAAASGMSGKEILEALIINQTTRYEETVSKQIALLHSDSTVTYSDYSAVLASTTGLAKQTALLDAALRLSTVAEASAVLNSLTNKVIDEVETQQVNDYVQLYEFFIELKTANKGIEELTPAQRTVLEALWGDENPAQITAMGILEVLDSVRTYQEQLPIWTDMPPLRKKNVNPLNPPKGDLLKVFPNPARDYVTIELIEAPINNTFFEVYNIKGELTAKCLFTSSSLVIPTTQWAVVVYTYKITTEGNAIEQGKFTVIK